MHPTSFPSIFPSSYTEMVRSICASISAFLQFVLCAYLVIECVCPPSSWSSRSLRKPLALARSQDSHPYSLAECRRRDFYFSFLFILTAAAKMNLAIAGWLSRSFARSHRARACVMLARSSRDGAILNLLCTNIIWPFGPSIARKEGALLSSTDLWGSSFIISVTLEGMLWKD